MVEFIAIEQVQFKSTLNTCQQRSMARGGVVQTLKNADGDKSHFSRGFTLHGRITPEEEASVEMKSDTCLFCDLLPSPWVHLILTSTSTNCCQHPKRASTTGVQLNFSPSVFHACHKLICMSLGCIHNGREQSKMRRRSNT